MTRNPKTLQEAYLSVYQPQELSEEIQIAAEYFYEQGLNEHGIDILIEELGLDEFIDFVYDIAEAEYSQGELLTKKLTARKSPGKSGPGAFTPVKPEKPEVEKPEETPRAPEGQLSFDFSTKKSSPAVRQHRRHGRVVPGPRLTFPSPKRANAVDTAVESQPPSKPISSSHRQHRRHGRVVPGPRLTFPSPKRANAVDTAVESQPPSKPISSSQTKQNILQRIAQRAGQDLKITGQLIRDITSKPENVDPRHREGIQQLRKKLRLSENFEIWIDCLLDEGYDLSDYTWDYMYEIYEESNGYIISYLLDEGYADTIESAEKILSCMSEEWVDEILNEADTRKVTTQPIRRRKPSQMPEPIPSDLIQGGKVTGSERLQGPPAQEYEPPPGASWIRVSDEERAARAARRAVRAARGGMGPIRIG